jgi:hypothetical protein
LAAVVIEVLVAIAKTMALNRAMLLFLKLVLYEGSTLVCCDCVFVKRLLLVHVLWNFMSLICTLVVSSLVLSCTAPKSELSQSGKGKWDVDTVTRIKASFGQSREVHPMIITFL